MIPELAPYHAAILAVRDEFDALPSVPMMMRQTPAGSLPLGA